MTLNNEVQSPLWLLQAARQVEFLVGKNQAGPNTDELEEAVAILQHHDGVSFTKHFFFSLQLCRITMLRLSHNILSEENKTYKKHGEINSFAASHHSFQEAFDGDLVCDIHSI